MKKLTLIVPVYNTAPYLKRCFHSLNHEEIEVIIVNDGSTDHSKEVIEELCKSNKSFKAIHIENQGAAHARRLGLTYVNTKFFGFVDSDDLINTKSYMNVCYQLDSYNLKVANGRMTVFLPNSRIPLTSRKWSKNIIDFKTDKREFSNITCSLLDKIFSSDLIPLFDQESKQVVYEDLEFVYYVLAKSEQMLHSNLPIYQYRMRGLSGNSTSAHGLHMKQSNGIKGLIGAGDSMKEKFKQDDLYQEYSDELDSIMIKLIFQRIKGIHGVKEIINKKEMIALLLELLNAYIPNWQNNPYYQERFKEAEWNDYLFYLISSYIIRKYRLPKTVQTQRDYHTILNDYDRKIKIKSL